MIAEPTREEVRRFGGGALPGAIARRNVATGPPAWVPPAVANLQLWMNAQVAASMHHAIGGDVDTWKDQSANGFVATTLLGPGLGATYSAAGGPLGKAKLDMLPNASQFGVPNNALLNGSTLTVFFAGLLHAGTATAYNSVIAKTNEGAGNLGWALGNRASTSNFQLWINNDASGGLSTQFFPTTEVYFSCAARFDGATISIWQGQTKLADAAYATPLVNTTGQLGISANSDVGAHVYFRGVFLETAYYNTALSDANVMLWLNRFNTDYGT